MARPSVPDLPTPDAVHSILVIRPRFVGDVCLTLPVISNLRRLAPQAALHYLVEEECAPLLADDPRLERVWVASRRAGALAQAKLAAGLRGAGFDLVLDLFCNPRTALWTAATGARWRVGYANKRLRSAAYNINPRTDTVSAVEFHLNALRALGWEPRYEVPQLALGEAELKAGWNHLAERGVPAGAELVGFHPGARWMTRRWAPEEYAAVGRRLLAERPRAWLLVFAGPGEEDAARAIAADVASPRALAITGVALWRFASLVALCRAFVGGDSGPVHVSVAAGTPTLGIYGRNTPEMFFPYPEARGHRAIYAGVWCSPCHRDVCDHLSCLRAISADWVWEVLRQTLDRAPTEAPRDTPEGPVPTALLGAPPKPRPKADPTAAS